MLSCGAPAGHHAGSASEGGRRLGPESGLPEAATSAASQDDGIEDIGDEIAREVLSPPNGRAT